MRTSLIAIAAVAGLTASAANAQLFLIPSSASVAGSHSGAGSSSSAGSFGNGASNSSSGAGNSSYGTSNVSSGPDASTQIVNGVTDYNGGVHNNVNTSSGTTGATYSTGNSLGHAGTLSQGHQGGNGFGFGYSFTPPSLNF